jgi:formylmethanofuran dehydrogenase subunit E
MSNSVIGGFVVKELPAEPKKKNEVAKCWQCGQYGRQSDMNIKDIRYYCKSHG